MPDGCTAFHCLKYVPFVFLRKTSVLLSSYVKLKMSFFEHKNKIPFL